jgi:hypothetical protein
VASLRGVWFLGTNILVPSFCSILVYKLTNIETTIEF